MSEQKEQKEQKKSKETVSFDLNTCTRCMACVASCPVKCLEEVNGDPAQTKPEACIKCGTCESVCAVGAVKLK